MYEDLAPICVTASISGEHLLEEIHVAIGIEKRGGVSHLGHAHELHLPAEKLLIARQVVLALGWIIRRAQDRYPAIPGAIGVCGDKLLPDEIGSHGKV